MFIRGILPIDLHEVRSPFLVGVLDGSSGGAGLCITVAMLHGMEYAWVTWCF